VNEAPNPVAALEEWLERFLDMYYEPRRAARTALFTSPEALASFPIADETRRMVKIFSRPLIKALRAGHTAGVIFSPKPEADADMMYAMVSAAADPNNHRIRDRSEARNQVMRFAWPAFGLQVKNQ
jgi:hypothetical protein